MVMLVASVLYEMKQQGAWIFAEETEKQKGRSPRSDERLAGETKLSELVSSVTPGTIVGALFCEISQIKLVNDIYGYSVGEKLLDIIAERFQARIPENSFLVRFGDEFLLGVSGVKTVQDLKYLAVQLIESLSEPVALEEIGEQFTTCHIGISWTKDRDHDASHLLRDARTARYLATKTDDRETRFVVFNEAGKEEAFRRLEVERELRLAVRNQQLVIYYQAIVDANTTQVVCYEALIRWDHPEKGIIAPAVFLPIASESDLIVEIGDYVLEHGCEQVANWQRTLSAPVKLAVNLAERQLLQHGFLEKISKYIALSGIDPKDLELEISEEMLAENLDRSKNILLELQRMGITLSIDDFGTSQASLTRLKSLSMVSTLKLDRIFVKDITFNKVDHAMASAMTQMAKSMGINVVAEGVEEQDQAQALQEMGVDYLQGFLFHRPESAKTLNIFSSQQSTLQL